MKMKKKQYGLIGLFIVALLFNIAFIFNGNVFADTLSTNYQPVIDNVNKTTDSIELQWHVSDDDYYYFNIYRATSKDGDYQLLSQSYFPYYTDYNFSAGVHYFYKIETVYFDENDDLQTSETTFIEDIFTPLAVPTLKSATAVKSHGITLSWNGTNDSQGYEIYRSTSSNGSYSLIKTVKATSFDYYMAPYSYTNKKLTVGKTYYYKIRAYVTYDNVKYYSNFSTIKYAQVRTDSSKITATYSKKPKTNTLYWKKISDGNGYVIYYTTKYDGKYKKLATLKGNNKLHYTHKKVKNGKAYYYKIYSYKTVSGKMLLSVEPGYYEKYCNYYSFENEPYDSRIQRLFGNSKTAWYKTAKIASKNMKTVRIKVWDRTTGGKKYTRHFYVTVNKGLAPSVKKMFKEIYKTKERFPIHDIGCYNWRGNGSASEHCIGTAFDINSNENYMIDNGQILAGSFWKPKKSKYSIPLKCQLVKILNKYGFERGFWGNRKDYMHFSYLGT